MLLRMFSYFLTVVNLAMYVMLPLLKEGKHTLLHSTKGHTSLSYVIYRPLFHICPSRLLICFLSRCLVDSKFNDTVKLST